MKVLVVSDTHGHAEQIKRVLDKTGAVDALVHCGDIEGQEEYIRRLADCPCYMVAGNNDCLLYTSLPGKRGQLLSQIISGRHETHVDACEKERQPDEGIEHAHQYLNNFFSAQF